MINLNEPDKAKFAEKFLDQFLSLGFGALPKREIEILVFHLLRNLGAFDDCSIYDLANILKISESKIKSLKIESSLKYDQVDHTEALKQIAEMFFESEMVKTELEQGSVQFALEDPILKREFEYAVKQTGSFVDYSFNRDILKVKPHIFLSVFATNFKEVNEKFVDFVKAEIKEKAEADKILNKALPLGQRIENFLNYNDKKISLVKEILSPVAAMIGLA